MLPSGTATDDATGLEQLKEGEWGIWMRGLGRQSEPVEKSHSWKDGSVGRPGTAMERSLELLSWPDIFWLSPYVLSRDS